MVDNKADQNQKQHCDAWKHHRSVTSPASVVSTSTFSPSSAVSMAHAGGMTGEKGSSSMATVSSSACYPGGKSPSQLLSATQPLKCAFFVSFIVDARGGAMTGGRGSGLRLIIPQVYK